MESVERHSEWKGHSGNALGWPAHLMYLYFWRFPLLVVGSFIFHRQAPESPGFLSFLMLSHFSSP